MNQVHVNHVKMIKPSYLCVLIISSLIPSIWTQFNDVNTKCLQYWVQYENSCYKFVKSEPVPIGEARRNCQSYEAKLASINSFDEHVFVMNQLSQQDPHHRQWYVGGKLSSNGKWLNDAEKNSPLIDIENVLLHESSTLNGYYVAYIYSVRLQKWGLEKVQGDQYFLYICEIPIKKLSVRAQEQSYQYNHNINDTQKVLCGPYFTKQPSDVLFDDSKKSITDYVTLRCIAGGYPTPTYEWFKEEYDNENQLIALKIDPLNNSRFTLNDGALIIYAPKMDEDRGGYHCKASNMFGSIISESIQVYFGFIDKINSQHSLECGNTNCVEPHFTTPLIDKHMDNQADLIWTCKAFGVPNVTYKWFKNGEPLDIKKLQSDDQRRYLIQDNVLNIKYLDAEKDVGMYQCQARNTLKTRYSSAQLTVLSLHLPSKKKLLESKIYGAEGKNLTMQCNPDSAPNFNFTWKKHGFIIESYERHHLLENGNLLINPVRKDDEGIYICIAQNNNDIKESKINLLVVRGPVFVEQLPPQIQSVIKHDLLLRCQAKSEEHLDMIYIWTHNNLPLLNFKAELIGHIIINSGELYIRNMTFEDSGEYKCIVRTVVGVISSVTTLSIDGPPGAPSIVQVEVLKTSVKLQWINGATNGRQITHYIISARTNWNSTWYNIATAVIAKEVNGYNGRKETLLENILLPWLKYEFRIVAGNDIGFGEISLPSFPINIPPDQPYKAPSDIAGGVDKNGDLTILWKPLPPQDQNGPDIYYKVFWRRMHCDTDYQYESLQDSGNIGMAVIHIKPEFYYTKYEIKVQAINSIGDGPISEPKVIDITEDKLQVSPKQIYASPYNATAFNVSWVPIDQYREMFRVKLIGYKLKYWINEQEEDAAYYWSRDTRPWALVVGLRPDTVYYVKVMAYNSAGEGPESEKFYIRTYRKPPQKAPSNVLLKDVSLDTISVTWRYIAPTLEEEPIQGYKIRVWDYGRNMSTAYEINVPIGGTLEAHITNLIRGKAYKLHVLAYSNGGNGISSPTQTFLIQT